MDISVIFATYKRPQILEKTIRSFLSLNTHAISWELILVDNAGDYATQTIVNKYIGILPITYLLVTKRGKNNALNRGIAEAQGKIFLFTDDDVIVEPNWLIEIWEGAKRWPGNHVFGGKILPHYPDGQKPPFDHPFINNAYAIADYDICEGIYKADRVWGPNMAIRSSIFKEGWMFNPNIGPDGTRTYVPGSEVELTNRLEEAGYPAVYLPRSVVYHQIRNEQLDIMWLYGRAFRFGQQFSYEENRPDMPMIFGIPRHLIRRFCKANIKYFLSLFKRDQTIRFDRAIDFWETIGRMNYYKNALFKWGN